MTLIVVGSLGGAPGVSTVALALAASWPGSGPVLLAELDGSGGDLAVRFGLDESAGLVRVAAVVRNRRPGGVGQAVWRATQPLGQVQVLVAPRGAEQASACLWALAEPLAEAAEGWAASSEVTVIADLGRLVPGAAAAGLLARASTVLVVARPYSDELAHVQASRVVAEARAELLLVGRGEYEAREVAWTLGMPVAGHLPIDRRAAAVLRGVPSRRPLSLASPLLRTAGWLAARLAARPAVSGHPAVGPAATVAAGRTWPGTPAERSAVREAGQGQAAQEEPARTVLYQRAFPPWTEYRRGAHRADQPTGQASAPGIPGAPHAPHASDRPDGSEGLEGEVWDEPRAV